MAYNVSSFVDYVARENGVLTKTLFAGGDTGRFANFISGVKGSTKIPQISGGVTLQEGACVTPSGSKVATHVDLTVVPFTVYEDFCQDDLQTKFPNMMLAPGSRATSDLKPWEEAIIDTIMAGVNETLELTYWQGTDGSGSYQLFDGCIAQVDAAGTAVDGNPTAIAAGTGIVAGNVIGIVEGMFMNAPAKIKRDGSFVILAGDDVFDLYIKALKDANLYHYSPEHDNGVYRIGGSGATLLRQYGLNGTDRLFASVGRNFHVGADVENEKDIADVFYDQTTDKMYVRVKAKAGVTLSNIDEIVEFTLA